MSDHDGQAGQADGVGEAAGRLAATEADKAKARKLFAHAKKASDTRNYDYAVELYVSGLACWPDAVEAEFSTHFGSEIADLGAECAIEGPFWMNHGGVQTSRPGAQTDATKSRQTCFFRTDQMNPSYQKCMIAKT